MADMKLVLDREEQKEKEELLMFVKELNQDKKALLHGFLQGLILGMEREQSFYKR